MMVWSDSNKVPPGLDHQDLPFGTGLRPASATTGLLLVLLLHLAGVVLASLAPQRFEAYAAALHRSAWLPPAELALLAVAHLTNAGINLGKL
jgi:succinate dehydrogenase / fumarate reductase cytochrome b subunit